MGESTEISWADATFNAVKGCEKVSPGCKRCYAERDTKRYGLKLWGPKEPRPRTTKDYWKQPLRWNREAQAAGKRTKVFCGSWCDVGEDHPDWVQPRHDLARLIERTTHLDWLLLTKRPENLARLFADAGWPGAWPGNVWVGATVEDQKRADERIPALLRVPATIRFLSCEPLLEEIDITAIKRTRAEGFMRPLDGRFNTISWVICGGESGHGARPFDLAWARSLRDQCKAAGVAYFFKQLGDNPILSPGPITWPSTAPKGHDPAEWPEDLRVQEFPR